LLSTVARPSRAGSLLGNYSKLEPTSYCSKPRAPLASTVDTGSKKFGGDRERLLCFPPAAGVRNSVLGPIPCWPARRWAHTPQVALLLLPDTCWGKGLSLSLPEVGGKGGGYQHPPAVARGHRQDTREGGVVRVVIGLDVIARSASDRGTLPPSLPEAPSPSLLVASSSSREQPASRQ
jgi:hypothetical protein